MDFISLLLCLSFSPFGQFFPPSVGQQQMKQMKVVPVSRGVIEFSVKGSWAVSFFFFFGCFVPAGKA